MRCGIEMVLLTIGVRCANLSRRNLANFIEGRVKPDTQHLVSCCRKDVVEIEVVDRS